MGYVYALNPFVGIFVYEVTEPAGVSEKKTVCRGVKSCSNTGHYLYYNSNQTSDGLWHIFATEAEASADLKRYLEERQRYHKEEKVRVAALAKERRDAGGRVHYPTFREMWLIEAYFKERLKQNPNATACSAFGAFAKVTCRRCLDAIRKWRVN
jgi:hypothetical protein